MAKIRIILILGVLAYLSGCAQTANRFNRSAVECLYPDRDQIVEKVRTAHLRLAIKLGIAFVPSHQDSIRHQRSGWSTGLIS